MKKLSAYFAALFLLLPFLPAQKYQISDYIITTSGKYKLTTTRPYVVELNFPLDKKTLFSQEELASYIKNYKQELTNSRAFEEINVDYEILDEFTDDKGQSISKIKMLINLKDSNHFLMVPYPKFKSDKDKTNIEVKLKAKDTNFLGTMNSLSTDANIEITKDNIQGKWIFKPGFNISYDYPFSAGPFDITWINDYAINYNSDYIYPEWTAKTGLKFVLPFRNLSFVLEGYQHFNNNFEYKDFNDSLYFKEEVSFSIPVKLYEFSNFSYLIYTPSINYNYIWDKDGINIENTALTSPIVSLSQSLSNSKINWRNNFRTGYSLALSNTWSYNFQRKDWVPSLSFEAKGFTAFPLEDRPYLDRLGITANIYAFTYFDMPGQFYDHKEAGYGEAIGSHLRGIPDSNYYFGNKTGSKNLDTTSTAFIMNIDLPVNIITTSFKKDTFNFNMQFSPFLDIAIYRDRALPLQADSKLCSGMEVLVYPKKWSSFIIRGSIGFDLKESFAADTNIKGLIKELWKNKEISIGLGLHY